VLPSTTAKACVTLLFIHSEDYILNKSLAFEVRAASPDGSTDKNNASRIPNFILISTS
jgi:hypothetical protein